MRAPCLERGRRVHLVAVSPSYDSLAEQCALETALKIRVFVVEDWHIARELLIEQLASAQCFELAGEAGGEGEATVWLEDNPGRWDLVVTDLVLADGSGFGVIQKARSLHPAGRIAVFSGFVSDGIRRHCLALGADFVCDKAGAEALVDCLQSLAPP